MLSGAHVPGSEMPEQSLSMPDAQTSQQEDKDIPKAISHFTISLQTGNRL